jgi:flagellin
MRINHNINALNAYRQLTINNSSLQKSLEKLSSGYRINRAGDDAAGLAISEKMRGQIRGLNMASKNSQDAISLIQTAEGALQETHAILQRMRELAVQAASDTNTDQDRKNIQDEINNLYKEIDRIAQSTEFNTKKLLDGSMGSEVTSAVTNVQINNSLKGFSAAASLLSGLTDKAGNSLGITAGDKIEISFIKDGQLFTAITTLGSGATVGNLALSNSVYTLSVSNNILRFKAAAPGYENAIYGITITVKDSSGNVKVAASNALSAFEEEVAAKDRRLEGTAIFQIGANTGQNISLSIENMSSKALGVEGLKVDTQQAANVAVKVLDGAIQKVSAERSKLGSYQNRLEHTINNLGTASENLTAAESRIRDVDMAQEMMEFTKQNILNQAATAMLAQANMLPQSVLKLLG